MEASIISALAALTGTAVGGLTSVAANWLNHRGQIRAQWLHHERNRRQILYRDFIEEASKCYIDALQHDEADISGLVGLYAKLSRMRVLSSKQVVHRAEAIARKILDAYLEPDKSFVELRDMAINGSIDLLHEFSIACREEFEQMRALQF
jgi:ferredoxin-NADP reductase